MSAYLSPVVMKVGDRIFTRGNWWTLSRVNHYEDGATMVRMWMDQDTGMDNARVEQTIDLDQSALWLIAEADEEVQMTMFPAVS